MSPTESDALLLRGRDSMREESSANFLYVLSLPRCVLFTCSIISEDRDGGVGGFAGKYMSKGSAKMTDSAA